MCWARVWLWVMVVRLLLKCSMLLEYIDEVGLRLIPEFQDWGGRYEVQYGR